MSNTFASAYTFAGAFTGLQPRSGAFDGTYEFDGSFAGSVPKSGTFSGGIDWSLVRMVGDNGIELEPDDRWRVIVQETRSGVITARDVTVKSLVVQRALSGGCDIGFDVDYHDTSVAGIYFKPWEQYIHLEKVMLGKRKIFATGIVQPSEVDPNTGVLHLKAQGFAAYPKGLPWLEDLNWLANDAFDPVVEIWEYLQSYSNGDLNVKITPKKSGVEMLPGYSFDGDLFNPNFFATFIRATDKVDCGDYIDGLARDIPFDYRERSEWNADRTDVVKTIELGYPRLGVIRETLAFILNENVLSAKPHTETQIDWISDVGITGFFPGVEYSAELANADPTRLRRYLDEDTAMIDSNERAKAWAGRRLARRQTPAYWEQITIDPNHPNAPIGSFDVGDTITVTGFMPWVGDIRQEHKIIALAVDATKNTYQLQLMAEGQFNYDPIFFPGTNTNIVGNPGFDNNITGWSPSDGGWQWDGSQGYKALGSVTIEADGSDHDLLTPPYGLSDFEIFPMRAYLKCSGAVSSASSIKLVAQFYNDALTPTTAVLVASFTPKGDVAWRRLGGGSVETPVGSTHVALRLHVGSQMTGGRVWFDDASLTL